MNTDLKDLDDKKALNLSMKLRLDHLADKYEQESGSPSEDSKPSLQISWNLSVISNQENLSDKNRLFLSV